MFENDISFSTCLNHETGVSFSLVPASTQPSWSSSAKDEQYTISNGSKGGGGKSSKSSKGLRVNAPAPKPAPDVWSGGARRLGGGKNSADRTLFWSAAPEAKVWTAAPVESVKSWSSPETKKKVWAAAPAWPSPSGWKKSMAPSICAPTLAPMTPATMSPAPTPTPTPAPTPAPTLAPTPAPTPAPTAPVETVTFAPTTCLDRKWYFSDGICTNGNDEDGSYSNLQSCCEEAQPGEECEFKDVCCMMRKWYFADGKCTNGFAPPEGGVFSSLVECCEAEQTIEKICTFDDVCVPEESTTPAPSVIFTPQPSTDSPTFGSTPTVSKEVTGPPTIPRRF